MSDKRCGDCVHASDFVNDVRMCSCYCRRTPNIIHKDPKADWCGEHQSKPKDEKKKFKSLAGV